MEATIWNIKIENITEKLKYFICNAIATSCDTYAFSSLFFFDVKDVALFCCNNELNYKNKRNRTITRRNCTRNTIYRNI